ncbi:lipopolysaccharide kinase InaA family protein [Geofilum sp. OHC36d9]|uniref:lipopolysaccharide kinase InaA family protein n=1 Tax=Geofilum sp. OHC36d9 TaxID=3458413 RepID=UPI004034C6B0
MLRYNIHPDFIDLKNYITDIGNTFQKEGKTIYHIRNEIKIIDHKELKLCVKSFGSPNLFNQLMYAYFRKSKAHRSFDNAIKLNSLHINTPQPVAWIEYRDKKGLIKQSYYLSLYQPHNFTMTTAFRLNGAQQNELIRQFAIYVYEKLHKNGVLHKDLNVGNILVIQTSQNYSFSLVDINRMTFKRRITPRQGLSNLRRMGGNAIEMSMLASYYSEACQQNPILGTVRLGIYKYRSQIFRRTRKKIFAPLKKRLAKG